MITLTTPHAIRTVLGGTAAINFDKVVIAPMTFDGVSQTINGTIRVSSSASPTEPPVMGTFSASVPGAQLLFEIPVLDIRKRVQLDSNLNTALLAQIEVVQQQIENGLLAMGLISGVRSPGV